MNSTPNKLTSCEAPPVRRAGLPAGRQVQAQRGFGLVEILLAVAIFASFISVFVAATIYGEEATRISGARVRASLMAEEGLEAMRNIRDAAFTNLADGTYGLATSSNQWVTSGTQDVTDIFTRQIVISTVDSNTKKVSATVTWQQTPQRGGSITLDTYLTNWLAATAASSSLPGTRLAYYDVTNTNLKYASCDTSCTASSSWTLATIDATGTVGQYASLAVDVNKPRIAYYDSTNGDLKYASCDATCSASSSWTIIAVDTGGTVGQYASLVLDSGKPRIAYYDSSNDALKYASCDATCTTAGNWTKITIASDKIGTYASLALDGTKPRISYINDRELSYASCDATCTTAGNWTTVIVATRGTDISYNSIAIDSGKPRIAYYDSVALKYASCEATCTNAGNWTKITVDSTAADIGLYPSLTLDGTKPRITYYNNSNSVFRYASCDATCTTAGNWTKITVDSTINRGQYASLAIDSSKLRTSYYDVTNGDLRYASCDTNCTTTSTRFYIQNAAPDYDPPTTRGAWDDPTGYDTSKKLSSVKSGSIVYNRTNKGTTADAWDILSIKAISDPLAAQTISGTVNWVTGAKEQHAICNAHYHMHIFVTVGDTDVVRGTLLTNSTDPAGTNEITTTYQGHGTNGGTAKNLTSLDIQAGDRIVVELGVVYYQTGNSHYVDLSYGGTGSTDLTVGGNSDTNPSWIEFSGGIALQAAPSGWTKIAIDTTGNVGQYSSTNK